MLPKRQHVSIDTATMVETPGFKFAILAALISAIAFSVNGEHELVATNQQAIGGSFDGCYSDAQNSLMVNGNYHQRFSRNSNSMCLRTCKNKGYAIAATKGADCYCSNSLPVPPLYEAGHTKASGNGGPCSTVCPGVYVFSQCRGDECCGGNNAYSVYIVDSIDILKELINRIALNFKKDQNLLHNRILSESEKSALNCQCFNGEVTIYLKANSLSKDGVTTIRTVKSVIDIANDHSIEEVTNNEVQDLRKVELVMKSIEKLLETDEPVRETLFGDWDLLCDNYFGAADLSCTKTFSESAGFSETFSTTHGVTAGVKIGIEVKNNFLFAESTKSFEASLGYSFTSGYSKTTSETVTEGFRISLTAPSGTKAEVRFFTSDIPVRIKWRANFFADGDVLIDYGGVGIRKSIHLSRLLSYDQRKLFAFGTIDYGERPTIIARTRTVDRDGNVITEREEESDANTNL